MIRPHERSSGSIRASAWEDRRRRRRPGSAIFLRTARLPSNSENALITRTANGTLEIAVWNYAEPERPGTPRTFAIDFGSPHLVNVYRVDDTHACSICTWKSMGSPRYPTRAQVQT